MHSTKRAQDRPIEAVTQAPPSFRQAQADYAAAQSLPAVWRQAADQFGDTLALHDPHAQPPVRLSFRQLWAQIQQFAAGLQAIGVEPGAHVALFSENQPRWFIADQGIMAAGAVDVVRSSQADADELLYILENSDATVLVIEHLKALKPLQAALSRLPIQRVIVLSEEALPADLPVSAQSFSQLMAMGENHPLQLPERSTSDLATLLYTSGTTGKPKGVMLTHGNLLHQITSLGSIVRVETGDNILSILPTWHVYERSIEYFALSQGGTLIYTNLRYFKRDLQDQHVHYFVSVPRLLEAIYEGVQKQLQQQPARRQQWVNRSLQISRQYIRARRIAQGFSLEQPNPSPLEKIQAQAQMLALRPLHQLADRLVYRQIREGIGSHLKMTISGGGTLSSELDRFFEIIGLTVLVGYGLTETSPVLTGRRTWHNLRGAVGQPIQNTEIRVVDTATRQPLPQGQQGSVQGRGPQVMKGYYKNPAATAKAIDADGWFDTEDLGWITPQQDLVLTGRAKDTIVLNNGENVEPQPLEDACLRSPYLDQMVVVGQDQRSLGALIVPHWDNLEPWAKAHQVTLQRPDAAQPSSAKPVPLPDNPPLRDFLRQEINREIKNRPGYSPNDRVGPFRLLSQPFSTDNGLMTQTLKIKRQAVVDEYQDVIAEMFSRGQ